MIVRIALAALLTLLAQLGECFPARRIAANDRPTPSPFQVMAEFDRLGGMDLWPGWDPNRTPVMIFDGTRTVLFNHPAPPSPFAPLDSHPGVFVMSGRNELITANSSAKLGGVQTATVMLQGLQRSATSTASLTLHEAFHVFEREKHPTWSGNEVELFTFPVTDTAIVTAQRLEAEALRRSLETSDVGASACWAMTAMRIRQRRFTTMTAGAAGYERGTELNEGLASYVEKRSIATPDSAVLTRVSFPPQAVRQRSYAVGLAIARLLDRFSSDWRATLEASDTTPLDALLTRSLSAGGPAGATRCEFTDAERQTAQVAAWTDIDSLRGSRELGRMSFLSQREWTLVVSAPTSPLFPQAFDPLNVTMLTEGEVLHTRYVKLVNNRGTLEVIGRPTLTSPAGAHPLFNGIRTATVAGLPADLKVERSAAGISVRSTGVQLELRNARADTSGKTITVRLLP